MTRIIDELSDLNWHEWSLLFGVCLLFGFSALLDFKFRVKYKAGGALPGPKGEVVKCPTSRL